MLSNIPIKEPIYEVCRCQKWHERSIGAFYCSGIIKSAVDLLIKHEHDRSLKIYAENWNLETQCPLLIPVTASDTAKE